MKIYSPPQDIKVPSLTLPFNQKNEEAAEDAYLEEVKKWITSLGYKGKYTGEIVRFPVADGKAQYMFADGPRSFLVYLPLGDAWQYRDAEYLPKKEIIRRIEADKSLAKLFGSK